MIKREGFVSLAPGKEFLSRLTTVTNASEVELVADVVMSEVPDTNNFTRIVSTSGMVPRLTRPAISTARVRPAATSFSPMAMFPGATSGRC